MVDRDKIQFDLFKLASGERLMRLSEPQSGLSLEKKLAPADAVARQKEKLLARLKRRLPRWNWPRRDLGLFKNADGEGCRRFLLVLASAFLRQQFPTRGNQSNQFC